MIDLFLLLELCTEEKGNFSLEFNPHKSYYEDAKKYFSEHFESDELEGVDLTKDIYILQWYQHTPIGFYTLIENNIQGIINRVLNVLEVPDCFLTPEADSVFFHGKYILVHRLHEPIAIAKSGVIEPIISLDEPPKAVDKGVLHE